MIKRDTFIIAMNLINEHNFTGATISKYSVPKEEPFALVDESQGFSMTM